MCTTQVKLSTINTLDFLGKHNSHIKCIAFANTQKIDCPSLQLIGTYTRKSHTCSSDFTMAWIKAKQIFLGMYEGTYVCTYTERNNAIGAACVSFAYAVRHNKMGNQSLSVVYDIKLYISWKITKTIILF